MSKGTPDLGATDLFDHPIKSDTARHNQDTTRILMTIDAVGGVWRYAMELAAALRSEGMTVIFAGVGPPPGPMQIREAERLGTLAWLDEPLDWMAGSERELDNLPCTLQQLVKRHAVDVVHLNLPSQAYGLTLDVPLLVASHSCPITWWHAMRDGPLPVSWQWLRQRTASGLRQAAIAIAPSQSHARLLERDYGPLPDLEVVHNAIAGTPWDGPKESFIFAAARWWDEGKNGFLLDAAAKDALRPVVMAGPTTGPNGQRFEILNARNVGEIPHGRVLDFMRRAAVFVSPSLYEPFGLAALEAARSRAALLLADIPTYRELWDGAAIFFDPRSPDSLRSAINKLSRDEDLASEWGERARAHSRQFDPARQAKSMAGLYRRLIRNSAPVSMSIEG